MKDIILVLFESDKVNTEEEIKQYEGVKHRFVEILTLADFRKNKNILNQYKGIIDCTNGNKLYKNILNNKKGIEYLEGTFKYLISSATRVIITTAPNISQLSAINYSKTDYINNKVNLDLEEYFLIINNVAKKIPSLRNKILFEEGIKQQGIIVNEVLEKSYEKIYKVVKEIPKFKENNVEYITLENINILSQLLKLKEVFI